jgi:hypothetical protein
MVELSVKSLLIDGIAIFTDETIKGDIKAPKLVVASMVLLTLLLIKYPLCDLSDNYALLFLSVLYNI